MDFVLYSPVQEGVSEGVEIAEGFVGVNDESVAWDNPLHLTVHDGCETVGGRLWPYPASWDILLQQIPDIYTHTTTGHQVRMNISSKSGRHTV